jgi:hypothetical protein
MTKRCGHLTQTCGTSLTLPLVGSALLTGTGRSNPDLFQVTLSFIRVRDWSITDTFFKSDPFGTVRTGTEKMSSTEVPPILGSSSSCAQQVKQDR